MLLRLPMTAGGCPPSPAEYGFGGVVYFQAGGMEKSQQPAGKADQVLGVRFVSRLVTIEVFAEALDNGSLVRVLCLQVIDVHGLGSELGMQRIQKLTPRREGCRQTGICVVLVCCWG